MYHAAFCKTKELLSLCTDWIKKREEDFLTCRFTRVTPAAMEIKR
jgi:hypothetical protein